MEEIFLTEGHAHHGFMWTVKCPKSEEANSNTASSTCIACLVEMLEDPILLIVKKKIVLSEFLRLIQNSTELPVLITHNLDVIKHIIVVITDLLTASEEHFICLIIEVCLKLLHLTKSDELIAIVLDIISQQIHENSLDAHKCLPQIILLGRLMDTFQRLRKSFFHFHGGVLSNLGKFLDHPSEEVQLAVVYAFILLIEDSDVDYLLMPNIQQQLTRAVILILSSSDHTTLLTTAIELVQRLMPNKVFMQLLFQMKIKGKTLFSSFKKLLQSKNETLQIAATHCIIELLTRWKNSPSCIILLESDLAEFLFESLCTRNVSQIRLIFRSISLLSEAEQFFTHFHSVYGIDSIISSLETLYEMKQNQVILSGLELMTRILKKQPDNISLFNNQNSVVSYLKIINKMINYQQKEITDVPLQAFTAILKKEHLLLPVPFPLLQEIMESFSCHVFELCKPLLQCRKPRKQATEDRYVAIVSKFLCLMEKACCFCLECQNDPKTCEDNYRIPDEKGSTPNTDSTLDSFKKSLLNIADTCSIPLVMVVGENSCNEILYQQFFGSLSHLYHIWQDEMNKLSEKLTATGFLCNMLELKYRFSSNKALSEMICQFFSELMDHLFNRLHGISLPTAISNGIRSCNCTLMDLSQIARETTDQETHQFLLALLYFGYLNHNECVPINILSEILEAVISCYSLLKVLPPYSLKHLIFLVSWHAFTSPQSQKITLTLNCHQSVVQIVEELETSIWFTDHPCVFGWIFTQLSLSCRAGYKVMQFWLDTKSIKDLEMWLHQMTIYHPSNKDSDPNLDPENIYTPLLESQYFLQTIMSLIADSSADHVEKCMALFHRSLQQNQTRGNKDLMAWLEEKSGEYLHKVLLKESQASDFNVSSLLSVMTELITNPTSDRVSLPDSRLIYHVVNLFVQLDPSIVGSTDVITNILYFLTSTFHRLFKGSLPNNNVVSFVTQRLHFLQNLEVYLRGSIECHGSLKYPAQMLLTQLLHFVGRDGKAAFSIQISLEDLIDQLKSPCYSHRLYAIELIAALFQTSLLSPLINVQLINVFTEGSTKTRQVDPGLVRSMYIYLQQEIIQDGSVKRDAAVQCVLKLLDYLDETNPSLAQKIILQPWNHVLLETLMQEKNISVLPDSILQLLIKFLEHKNGSTLMRRHLEQMMQNYLISVSENMEPSICNSQRTSLKKLMQKLIELVANDEVEATLVQKVKKIIQNEETCNF